MSTGLCNLKWSFSKFFAEDFQNTRTAESALATAHSGAETHLDGTDASCAHRSADGVADLGFCDLFTATYDLCVIRIFCDGSSSFVRCHGAEGFFDHTARFVVGVNFRVFAVYQDLDHINGDRRGSSDTRRFDACQVDEVRSIFRLAQNEIIAVRMSAATP